MSPTPPIASIRTTVEVLVDRHAAALKRAGLLFGLLLVELLVVTNWLDGAELSDRPGLAGQIGVLGAWILRFLVGLTAAFAAFSGLGGTWKLAEQLDHAGLPQWGWLIAHPILAAAFAVASAALWGNWPSVTTPNLLALGWVLLGLFTLLSACLGFFPTRFWRGLLHAPGQVWIAATTVPTLGIMAVAWSQSMWQSAAQLTFALVEFLLRPLIPDLIVEPAKMHLRGHRFGVIISQECSGLEGVGLMLVFSITWLWLYRREFRFPRAYLLVPAGVVTLYLLNAVRIALLLLLGDAGAERIAAGGFHSQAGWIAFNGVALAMTLIIPRLSWFSLHPPLRAPRAETLGDNPTAVFLIPFLAILAAGMLSRAASADFEWLYGLRFVAAAGALWTFRDQLRKLDWRCGWWGPIGGTAVFALWLGFDRWQGIPAAAMPSPLAGASTPLQFSWIVMRALAATTTVPIAEELAFRGFLMRRLTATDFETIPLRSATWFAVLASSVAFGLLHGDRWLAGILAGLAFALVARRTNRIGEAVIAHAVTNALLASWVLYLGQWQYW